MRVIGYSAFISSVAIAVASIMDPMTIPVLARDRSGSGPVQHALAAFDCNRSGLGRGFRWLMSGASPGM
jgi:hypothetical protein